MDVLLEKDDFLKTYRSITGQLKRKFARKPLNVPEAVEAYENLARQQADVGFIELSAACRLAAAQLEQATTSSCSSVTSNHLYLESARVFSTVSDGANSFFCYEAAINSSTDPSITWMCSMEAGKMALHLQKYCSATSFFLKAYKVAESDLEKSLSNEHLVSTYIRQGLYADALKTLSSAGKGNVTLDVQKVLVTKILLSLNLRRHGNGECKLSQCIATAFEQSKGAFQPVELQFAIDSLLRCGSEEVDESLFLILWQNLNEDQQQLLMGLCI